MSLPIGRSRVSAVIPAYNEENTIGSVVRLLRDHPLVHETIVVSDGSTDATAACAEMNGVKVIRLNRNVGKGEAMAVGVAHATGDIVLFADADLTGFSSHMVSGLLSRVLSGDFDMYALVRDRTSEYFQLRLPSQYVVGGERALRRSLWEAVPPEDRRGFGVELALNYYAQKHGLRIGHELAEGLGQVIKEKKRGLVLGFVLRLHMVAQCVKALVKLHILHRESAFA